MKWTKGFTLKIFEGKLGRERTRWTVLDDGEYYHIMPTTDILPHGTRESARRYVLSASCACGPKIEFGNTEGIYERPVVMHNSFRDEKRIMNRIRKILK